jgi:hypothetical protein
VAKYVTAVLKICKRKHPQIKVGQAAIKRLISLKKPKHTKLARCDRNSEI